MHVRSIINQIISLKAPNSESSKKAASLFNCASSDPSDGGLET